MIDHWGVVSFVANIVYLIILALIGVIYRNLQAEIKNTLTSLKEQVNKSQATNDKVIELKKDYENLKEDVHDNKISINENKGKIADYNAKFSEVYNRLKNHHEKIENFEQRVNFLISTIRQDKKEGDAGG